MRANRRSIKLRMTNVSFVRNAGFISFNNSWALELMKRFKAASVEGDKNFSISPKFRMNILEKFYLRITEFPLAILSTPIWMSLTLKSIFTCSVVRYVRPSGPSCGVALKYIFDLTPSVIAENNYDYDGSTLVSDCLFCIHATHKLVFQFRSHSFYSFCCSTYHIRPNIHRHQMLWPKSKHRLNDIGL